mgnify:CR=1 FL=1
MNKLHLLGVYAPRTLMLNPDFYMKSILKKVIKIKMSTVRYSSKAFVAQKLQERRYETEDDF